MRRKFTMLLASVCLCVGTAWADNVGFGTNSDPALPGTLSNGQNTWKSSNMTAPEGFTTLRLTFVNSNGGLDTGGYPHVALAEFYLYDAEGQAVELTVDRLSSNATETQEAGSGIDELCDGSTTKQDGEGDYDWYWHSYWSANAGAFHYLEINVAGLTADLSTFAVGYVTRQEAGSPTEIVVTTGSSTDDVNTQCPNVEITYNHIFNGDTKKTEVLKSVVGASYPQPTLPWGVSAELPSGVIEEAGSVDLTCTYNGELPFVSAATYDDISKWYYLALNKTKQYIRYNEADTFIPMGITWQPTDVYAYTWAFVGNPYDGYKLYNRKAGEGKILSSAINVYDGDTGGNTYPLVKDEEAIDEETANKIWTISQSTSISGENGMYIGLTSSTKETIYMNDRGKLAFWTGGKGSGSTFTVREFAVDDVFTTAKTYALKNLAALAQATSIYTDVETARETIESIEYEANESSVSAALNSLNEAMNSLVDGKFFTLQNVSDATKYLTTNEGYAAVTTTNDISAYWALVQENGVFKMYNRFNGTYLSAIPNANETRVESTSNIAIAADYIVEGIGTDILAFTSFLEASSGENLYLHRASGDRIVRWNAAAATTASHWTIAEVDYAAAFADLIEEGGLEGKVFSETPALGEYPMTAKETFNTIKTAYESDPTVENELALIAAVEALEKSKNLPLFTIDGVISYASGKSIYDDNDGTLNFKKTNAFDKTMLWAFDQTETTVGVIDEVVVTNYATGNLFWGAASITITETSDNDGAGITDDGIFLFYTTGNGTPVHYQNDNQVIVRWADTGAASGSAHKFTYVGNSYDLDQLADSYYEAVNALDDALQASQTWNTYLGEGLGMYSNSTDFIDAQNAASTILTTTRYGATENDLTAAKEAITAGIDALSLNMPVEGKFYTFKNDSYYITSNVNSSDRIALSETKDVATIYYYDGSHLLAYSTGLYFGLDGSNWTFEEVGSTSVSEIVFVEAANGVATKYNIKSGGRWLHRTDAYVNRCQNNTCGNAHNWTIEEVTTLPVTISAVGYATLHAPVALSIPENVKVYTGTLNGEWLTLNEVSTTIPANTPVILEATETLAEATVFEFPVVSDVTAISENALSGTTAAEATSGTLYTLQSNGDGGVVFKKYTGTNLGGFRAHLVLSETTAAQAIRIRKGNEVNGDGGTTGIDGSVLDAQDSQHIYDLMGRKVTTMKQGGIYIVNGKKVVK